MYLKIKKLRDSLNLGNKALISANIFKTQNSSVHWSTQQRRASQQLNQLIIPAKQSIQTTLPHMSAQNSHNIYHNHWFPLSPTARIITNAKLNEPCPFPENRIIIPLSFFFPSYRGGPETTSLG
ncbi:hypothetical protein CEXT_141201 [Caerostris extrusa]|uniref:Uncharacterized protein n=1 Tax=Caerostris extrusa TaxID=172846 RepID=A0AAV4SD70_CAEEX|nr:hypothetical protein CEXT_141201 [Caerostris extrusa]